MKQVHYRCVISKQDSAGILLNCSLASRLVIESSGAESLSGPDNVDDRIRSTRARARIPISQLTFEFNGVWRTDKKEGSDNRGWAEESSNEGGEKGPRLGVGGRADPRRGEGEGGSRGRPVGA